MLSDSFIRCPVCDSWETRTIDTQTDSAEHIMKRECRSCERLYAVVYEAVRKEVTADEDTEGDA